jgi:hypothetical protein
MVGELDFIEVPKGKSSLKVNTAPLGRSIIGGASRRQTVSLFYALRTDLQHQAS